ncbi:EmrB/QacA subfamily drug resistance transporter [Asanoa ferruginea]|uniref:EmrB/QacA subfamily drug resistance transporter n=1 Tax=Asanoa ferruginea TaxID=53367 RepID=A0A3D9ZSD3_9ACTN|nr:MFS transporter [Asanoa ferruginea]REG00307.1 EmrB/QacA subfamily drug resistance transporter [Asanoa ferruginea]
MTTVPQPLTLRAWRGRRVLALLCAVAFLDFVDASITNVALPHIMSDLGFSVQSLQWVPSAYLLTYGGFMLLGGRLADLLGRRDVLLAGTVLLGLSSLAGGLATNTGLFVAARLVQGLGAALMLPAALSTLTTSFTTSKDRHSALGVWAAVAGLASAVGILLGGVLTEGLGWRWVMFVNPIACVLVIPAVLALLPRDLPAARTARFDLLGSVVVTGGTLLLVYALIKAPDQGWGATRTWLELAGAAVLLGSFVLIERSARDPILPLNIFRVPGLAAANLTGLIGFAGMLSMFYFLTLYMQTVLGYSAIAAGAAYLPLTVGVGIGAGIGAKLLTKVGSRAVICTGALVAAAGLFLLSQVPVDGGYLGHILPGLLLVAFGVGPVFVGVTSAANAGVGPSRAGLAAAILNSSQQIGGALGLAIFSAVGAARTHHLLATGGSASIATTSGLGYALGAGAAVTVAAALVALATVNTREGESPMNKPERVLIVGRSPSVLVDAVDILRADGYTANATNQFDRVLDDYDVTDLDVLVFGGHGPRRHQGTTPRQSRRTQSPGDLRAGPRRHRRPHRRPGARRHIAGNTGRRQLRRGEARGAPHARHARHRHGRGLVGHVVHAAGAEERVDAGLRRAARRGIARSPAP